MASVNEHKLWGALPRAHLTDQFPRMSETMRKQLIARLGQFLPADRLLVEDDRLMAYSYDATGERHRPDVVAIAGTVGEAVKLMAITEEFGAVVIARGSGSNLSGGTMPVVGGVVVGLSRLRVIREVDLNNRRAVVEPGVVNADLQQRLRPLGFFYPPDPASHRIATLGGNIAENSGGPHCVKYGVTTNHVLGLEVVLADGSFRATPPTGTERLGLDIAGLLTGSEGTLALVVGLILSIAPLPQATRTMLAIFSQLDDSMRCVSAIVAAKIVPSTLELLDRKSLQIIEPFVHAGYPMDAEAVLLIEVDGVADTLSEAVRTIRIVAEASGAVEFREAKTDAEAEALWRGRRAHYGAAARLAPHLWVQDVTVPRPLLPDMVRDVLAIGQRWGFDILTAAHVGDGNLHPVITYDPANADEMERMRGADHEILEACVRYGGSITGEHGIGIDKVENLALMYSPDELHVMHELKIAFDPSQRLNPLKAVLPGEGHGAVAASPYSLEPEMQPTHVSEAQDIIRAAYHGQQTLTVRGQGLRLDLYRPDDRGFVVDTRLWRKVRDFDVDNLTIEVESGMTGGDLANLIRSRDLDLPGLYPGQEDTVGGLIASNLRTWRSGLTWRDWVLGVEWLDGRGRLLRFGRKTMKNVAGYDVTKLAIGSQGTLGILSSVILRLRPQSPQAWVAQMESFSPEPLLTLAIQWLQLSTRPDGLVIARDEQGRWRLVMVGASRVARSEYDAAAQGAGLTLNWTGQALEIADSLDAWRDHCWASREKGYAEGAVRPTELLSLLPQLPATGPIILFPYSGAYEIYGPVLESIPGLLRWIDKNTSHQALTSTWSDIEKRIERVFDPHALFAQRPKDV